MKNNFIKMILFLMIIASFGSSNGYSYSKGWNIYDNSNGKTTWFYVYDDGTMAQKWQYINRNWYYFWPQDEGGITLVGNAYITKYGTWTYLWDSAYQIDGQTYYFDTEGKLICNADVCINEIYYHIDENGHSHELFMH